MNMSDIRKSKIANDICSNYGLSKDAMLYYPIVYIYGDKELIIENFKGIYEYNSDNITIKTVNGFIKIAGKGFEIRQFDSEDIRIFGDIKNIVFGGLNDDI